MLLDYVIIGAGITGCYLAYSLRKLYPNATILILEGSSRVGGRLLSKELDGDNVYDLGGMRFSKTSHVLVRSMLEELSIEYQPITSIIPGSKSMSKMLDEVECVTDEGFVTYAWNHGHDPIRMSMTEGYDILMNDITLKLMYNDNNIVPDWNRVPIGFQNVCKRLIEGIDIRFKSLAVSIENNTIILKDGTSISSKNAPIFTGQPDALSILTNIDYMSSFVPYSALRIYIPYKSSYPMGYSTKLPLRKIQSIGNATLIYCDSGSSNVLLSLIENKKYKIIMRWIARITGIHIPIENIKKLMYKYWINGIYFYKPYKKSIEPGINYMNSDISEKPGWIEGSLELVRNYITRTVQ